MTTKEKVVRLDENYLAALSAEDRVNIRGQLGHLQQLQFRLGDKFSAILTKEVNREIKRGRISPSLISQAAISIMLRTAITHAAQIMGRPMVWEWARGEIEEGKALEEAAIAMLAKPEGKPS